MELWKKLARPGEPQKPFAGLAGSWTTIAKEWMEPGKPPTAATGTTEMKMLLDGRFLYQDYNGQILREKPTQALAVTYIKESWAILKLRETLQTLTEATRIATSVNRHW